MQAQNSATSSTPAVHQAVHVRISSNMLQSCRARPKTTLRSSTPQAHQDTKFSSCCSSSTCDCKVSLMMVSSCSLKKTKMLSVSFLPCRARSCENMARLSCEALATRSLFRGLKPSFPENENPSEASCLFCATFKTWLLDLLRRVAADSKCSEAKRLCLARCQTW